MHKYSFEAQAMTSRGRPIKKMTEKRIEHLDIRLDLDEKESFKDAASVAGVPLSVWVRERLRQTAIKELEAVRHPIKFLNKVRLE
jgi:uncharacterized protein (DUF1778 family)